MKKILSVTGKGSNKTALIKKLYKARWAIQLLNHVFGLLNRARFRQFKEKVNYSNAHFQFNQTPPLEVLSLRSRIFQTLSVFSVKFTRIQSWAVSFTRCWHLPRFQLDFLQREFLIGLFVVRCTIWLAIRKHCRSKQVLRKYLSVMI